MSLIALLSILASAGFLGSKYLDIRSKERQTTKALKIEENLGILADKAKLRGERNTAVRERTALEYNMQRIRENSRIARMLEANQAMTELQMGLRDRQQQRLDAIAQVLGKPSGGDTLNQPMTMTALLSR